MRRPEEKIPQSGQSDSHEISPEVVKARELQNYITQLQTLANLVNNRALVEKAGKKNDKEKLSPVSPPLKDLMLWLSNEILKIGDPRFKKKDCGIRLDIIPHCALLAVIQLSDGDYQDLIDLAEGILNPSTQKFFQTLFSKKDQEKLHRFIERVITLRLPVSTLLNRQCLTDIYNELFLDTRVNDESTEFLILLDTFESYAKTMIYLAHLDTSNQQPTVSRALVAAAREWLALLTKATKEVFAGQTYSIPNFSFYDELMYYRVDFFALLESHILLSYPLEELEVSPSTLESMLLEILTELEFEIDFSQNTTVKNKFEFEKMILSTSEIVDYTEKLIEELSVKHKMFLVLKNESTASTYNEQTLKDIHEYLSILDMLNSLFILLQNRVDLDLVPSEKLKKNISFYNFLQLTEKIAQVPGLTMIVINALSFFRREMLIQIEKLTLKKGDNNTTREKKVELKKSISKIDTTIHIYSSFLLSHTWYVYSETRSQMRTEEEFLASDVKDLYSKVLTSLMFPLFEGETAFDRFLKAHTKKNGHENIQVTVGREINSFSHDWNILNVDPPLLLCLRKAPNAVTEKIPETYEFVLIGIGIHITFSVLTSVNHEKLAVGNSHFSINSAVLPDEVWDTVQRISDKKASNAHIFDVLKVIGFGGSDADFVSVTSELIIQFESRKKIYLRAVENARDIDISESGDGFDDDTKDTDGIL